MWTRRDGANIYAIYFNRITIFIFFADQHVAVELDIGKSLLTYGSNQRISCSTKQSNIQTELRFQHHDLKIIRSEDYGYVDVIHEKRQGWQRIDRFPHLFLEFLIPKLTGSGEIVVFLNATPAFNATKVSCAAASVRTGFKFEFKVPVSLKLNEIEWTSFKLNWMKKTSEKIIIENCNY